MISDVLAVKFVKMLHFQQLKPTAQVFCGTQSVSIDCMNIVPSACSVQIPLLQSLWVSIGQNVNYFLQLNSSIFSLFPERVIDVLPRTLVRCDTVYMCNVYMFLFMFVCLLAC